MKETIVILETSDVGATSTAMAVKNLGYLPLFLTKPGSYQGDTLDQLHEWPYVECDTTSVLEMVDVLSGLNRRIVGVFTALDSRLHVSIALAKSLGIKHIDDAVMSLKSKNQVCRIIPEFSPKNMEFDTKAISKEKLESFIGECERAIIKPEATAGGVGTFEVTPSSNLEDVLSEVRKCDFGTHLNSSKWLLQEFLQGSLYSYEGYVTKGQVHFLGVSSRKKIGQTESQVKFPVDFSLSKETLSRAKEAISILIQRSGFANGYFHIEFIATSRGPLIIDANMGRVGGGSIVQQLALSFHTDTVFVMEHIIKNSLFCDEPNESPFVFPPDLTFGLAYGAQKNTFLEEIYIPKNSNLLHTQLLNVGQLVPAMGDNNWSWIGIICGKDSDMNRHLTDIKLRTKDGIQLAVF